jgi:hypothetical protein
MLDDMFQDIRLKLLCEVDLMMPLAKFPAAFDLSVLTDIDVRLAGLRDASFPSSFESAVFCNLDDTLSFKVLSSVRLADLGTKHILSNFFSNASGS